MDIVQTEDVELYAFQKAKMGNIESGDVYYIYAGEDYCLFAIADGLGSGPIARQSAEIISVVLNEHHHESPEELLSRCNEYMIQKRGAAVAIVKIDYERRILEYSCVGNVRFYLLHNDQQMIYPLPVMGYLSGRPQKLNTQTYTYQAGDVFFLHSDGVNLRSPKSLLKESCCMNEIYQCAMQTIKEEDDATFITGSLLR